MSSLVRETGPGTFTLLSRRQLTAYVAGASAQSFVAEFGSYFQSVVNDEPGWQDVLNVLVQAGENLPPWPTV